MEPVQRWTGSLLNARIGAASAGECDLEIDADDLLADEALEVIEPLPVGKVRILRALADRLVDPNEPTIGGQALVDRDLDGLVDLIRGQRRGRLGSPCG